MKTIVMQLLLTLMLTSCATHQAASKCAGTARDFSLKQALRWYQSASEQKALYRQSFAAGMRFVEDFVHKHHPKKHSWGVVLDIDETVLDNSWYFQQCGHTPANEAEFSRYISLAKKSLALPGAAAFTHNVNKLGGYVTLLSNRDGAYGDAQANVMDATIENLREQGVYFDQVVLANHALSPHPKDKNPRFKATVTGNYDPNNMVWSVQLPPHDVIAYFGDNIQDFPDLTQKEMQKLKSDDKKFDMFSRGYFIMPNPMYGSWEDH